MRLRAWLIAAAVSIVLSYGWCELTQRTLFEWFGVGHRSPSLMFRISIALLFFGTFRGIAGEPFKVKP